MPSCKRRLGILLLSAALSVAASGCGFIKTPIAEIVAHPRDYADKEVTVEGQVNGVFGFFTVKYFTLKDSSGEIGVITERPLPARGDTLRVRGRVKEAFSLGDRTEVVLVENAGH